MEPGDPLSSHPASPPPHHLFPPATYKYWINLQSWTQFGHEGRGGGEMNSHDVPSSFETSFETRLLHDQ